MKKTPFTIELDDYQTESEKVSGWLKFRMERRKKKYTALGYKVTQISLNKLLIEDQPMTKRLRASKEIIDEVRTLSETKSPIQIIFYDKGDNVLDIVESSRFLINESTKRARRPTALLQYLSLMAQCGISDYCEVVGFEKE